MAHGLIENIEHGNVKMMLFIDKGLFSSWNKDVRILN